MLRVSTLWWELSIIVCHLPKHTHSVFDAASLTYGDNISSSDCCCAKTIIRGCVCSEGW